MKQHQERSDLLNNNKIVQYFIMALALVLPLSRMAVSILSITIIIIWVIQAKPWSNLKVITHHKIGVSILLFLAFMMLSLLWTEHISNGINKALDYRWWLLIPAVAYFMDRASIQRTTTAFLIGMAIAKQSSGPCI